MTNDKQKYEEGCIFCKLAEGILPAFKIYETANHLAFLDVYPNRPGQSIVMPKSHLSSNIFELKKNDYVQLMIAAKSVGEKIKNGLNTQRIFVVAEGLEVDHAHLKLYPIIRISKRIAEEETRYSDEYDGYITTLHGPRLNDEELKAISEKINKMNLK